jgi:hypothetical protein
MPKIKVKGGDIFEVPMEDKKAYFQYVFQDIEFLGGHLLRVFDYEISKDKEAWIEDIVKAKVRFYAYTRLTQGIEENLWHKVGNFPIEQNFEPPLFRQTPDVYSVTKKSYRWNIFKAGTPERAQIGEVTDEYKDLPVAGVKPPSAIVQQIKTGWDGFLRPE